MTHELKYLLRRCITKEFLIDVEDGVRGEVLKAHTVIRDHTGLDARRGRVSEGRLRFPMMEHRFEEVAKLHGWLPLDNDVLPGTDLKVFQPFVRMEAEGQGVILGLATLPEPRSLPSKNKSRKAAVVLNYDLIPRLDFEGTGPKIGDIYAILGVARDRERAGQIEEIAIGVIGAEYDTYILYESLDKFLSDEEDTTSPHPSNPTDPTPTPPTPVALKKKVIPFVPPEKRNGVGDKTGTE
ncbi:MAG: hypothetical protein QM647_09280 [Asticcacaulis sp.]|uniref:hypothetical protein n=1 Tax=Asticcacaulis sp. TaxID=1872648 RepID=UPI0039E61594